MLPKGIFFLPQRLLERVVVKKIIQEKGLQIQKFWFNQSFHVKGYN